MHKSFVLISIFISSNLLALDVFIPNVNVPSGCYPGGKFIYHQYNVVEISGLETNHLYYIKRDDNQDLTPYLSYIELLYPPGGSFIVHDDFVVVGNGGNEGLLYMYTGSNSTAYFDYNFEILNSSLTSIGESTNRPTIRIREFLTLSVIRVSSTITIINPSTISGASLWCNNPISFNLLDQPYGSTVTWKMYQNNNVFSQGAGTLAQSSNGSNGPALVEYTIDFDCSSNSYILIKDFWIGPPIANTVLGPTEGYNYNTYTFYASPRRDPNSGTEYSWILNPQLNNSVRPYYDYVDISFYTSYECYQVLYQASNSCGSTDWAMSNICIYDEYLLAPNPASSIITISVNKMDISRPEAEYSISILDYLGNSILSLKASGNDIVIPINKLIDGKYLIKISRNGKSSFLPFIKKN